MIAVWLFYGCALGGLLGLGAAALERVAVLMRAPTRWVWLGALIATAAIPLVLALHPQDPGRASAVTGGVPVARRPVSSDQTLVTVPQLGPSVVRLEVLTIPLLGGWGLGTVLLAGMLLRGWLAQRRARRRWRLAAVEGRQVLVAPDAGPAVVGVRGLEIVLPEWALSGDAAALRMMLRHEAQHVRARDPNLLLMAGVALVLMPWNPALWWQMRRLRLAIEVDCDRRVLGLGEDVGGYGALLLDVAARYCGAVVIPGPAFLESVSQLERRIEAMSARQPRRRMLRALAFGALGAVAVVAACEAPRPAPIASAERRKATVGADTSHAQPSEGFSLVIERSQTGWSARCVAVCRWTALTFNYGQHPARITSAGVTNDLSEAADTVGFAFEFRPDDRGWTATAISGTRWRTLSWRCPPGAPVCRARVTISGVTGG